MATLYPKRVLRVVMATKKIESIARDRAEKKLATGKTRLNKEFQEHEVTKELAGGIDASNTSDTLAGATLGNLFSFIGFNRRTKPVQQVEKIFDQISLGKKEKVREVSDTRAEVTFKVNIPSEEKITKQTPMPWERGRSWLYGIERGISGLGYYLGFVKSKKSRSGRGIQAKHVVRENATFKRTPYFSQLMKNFNEFIRK